MNLFTNLSKGASIACVALRKNAPQILIGTGLVAATASTFFACKATLKVKDILEDSKKKMNDIETVANDEELCKKHNYTAADIRRDMVIVQGDKIKKLVLVYAPAALLAIGSTAAIIGGTTILHRRNLALSTALTSTVAAFAAYRNRVKETVGEDKERDIYMGLKESEVLKTIIDEKGKEKTIKEKIKVKSNSDMPSPYARYYDETCLTYEPCEDLNLATINAETKRAQFAYESNIGKFVTLDYIYRQRLGILPRDEKELFMWNNVGWKQRADKTGDDHIDLRPQLVYIPTPEGGTKAVWMLDPNVDGFIFSDAVNVNEEDE